jgi:hypothetical protein
MIVDTNGVITQINIDYNTMFQANKADYLVQVNKQKQVEGLAGIACLKRLALYNAAFVLWVMIYNRITDPLAETLTWEEYEVEFNLPALYIAYGKQGVNLTKIMTSFDFQALIDAQ